MNVDIRAADPARDLRASSTSPQASALLQRIYADRSHGRRVNRRVAFVAVLAAAMIAAVLAIVLPSRDQDGPGVTNAAFTLDTGADGTLTVDLNLAKFHDARSLQRALDARHAQVVVFDSAHARVVADFDDPLPACAMFRRVDAPPRALDVTGDRKGYLHIVVRPTLIPRGHTGVILVFARGTGAKRRLGGVVMPMLAAGRPPTCAAVVSERDYGAFKVPPKR